MQPVGRPEMKHEEGCQTRRRGRGVELSGPHGRASYCSNKRGWSALEPRHHHAPRTRRRRRYTHSGRLNVIAVLMAPCHLHAACQPPAEAGLPSKLLGCRAFDQRRGHWPSGSGRMADCGRSSRTAWKPTITPYGTARRRRRRCGRPIRRCGGLYDTRRFAKKAREMLSAKCGVRPPTAPLLHRSGHARGGSPRQSGRRPDRECRHGCKQREGRAAVKRG